MLRIIVLCIILSATNILKQYVAHHLISIMYLSTIVTLLMLIVVDWQITNSSFTRKAAFLVAGTVSCSPGYQNQNQVNINYCILFCQYQLFHCGIFQLIGAVSTTTRVTSTNVRLENNMLLFVLKRWYAFRLLCHFCNPGVVLRPWVVWLRYYASLW